LEIRRYLRILRRWWWLLLAATVIAAGSSYFATRSAPRVYSSRARIMVGESVKSRNPDWVDITIAQQLAMTYVELVTTRPILQEVVDTLGLQSSPDALRGMISVKLVQGTQILDITVIDTDPVRAAAIANAVGEVMEQQPLVGGASEAQIRSDALEELRDLKDRIDFAKLEVQNLDAAILEEDSARAIAELQNRRDLRQQQITQWQATYAQLYAAYTGSEANIVTVVEQAEPNYVPVGPQVTTNVALAGAIGAMLAVGAILLLEYLDDTVKTGEEMASLAETTFLGIIPRVRGDSKEAADRLLTLHQPRSTFSECFRVLRTNLQFSSFDRPLRTILVTSPQPTEGKSTTAANLAVVLAQAGRRVILVDSDLRRPILHRMFDYPNDWGLTNILFSGDRRGTDGFMPTKVENLLFIPSGPLPPNPSEILGSQRMEALIERLKEMADVIVFDSPPLLTVTDANVLATKVDGVLLVADSGTTRREGIKKAVEALNQVGAHILGTTLNRVSTRSDGYYYYYYSRYYSDERGEAPRKRRRHKHGRSRDSKQEAGQQ